MIYPMYYFDPTYALVLVGVVLSLLTSARVKSTFNKYSRMHNSRGITGAQAARYVLDANGLRDVRIEHISGNLTDHFDPRDNVVRLSDGVYGSTSTAAIGIACHEVGHAIQHATNYAPVKIRTAIVPITNIGSKLAMPLILLGLSVAIANFMVSLLYYIRIIIL